MGFLSRLFGTAPTRDSASAAQLAELNQRIFQARSPQDMVAAFLAKGSLLDRRMGAVDQAREHYERALGFAPAHPVGLLLACELAVRAGDVGQAAGLVEGAQPSAEDGSLRASFLLARAVIARRRGQEPTARDLLEEARAADPALAMALVPGADLSDLLRDRARTLGEALLEECGLHG